MRNTIRTGLAIACAVFMARTSFAQQEKEQPDGAGETRDKRIFGIIPNARSSPSLARYEPLTVKQKFKIATNDSFDRGTIVLGAVFGAQAQLTRANPSFGNGVAASGKYFGTAYGDLLIGNMMTEGVFPSVLHQDPRYFRRGTGTTWSRLGYSLKQIFWTRTDSGGGQFNYSEVAGNATAVAISNAYYPDNRSVGDAVTKLGSQIGVDLAANVLKEFAPDITRRLLRKRDQK